MKLNSPYRQSDLDLRNANRDVLIEVAAIICFLLGLILLMAPVAVVTMLYAHKIAPQSATPNPWDLMFPESEEMANRELAIFLLEWITPTACLMSAGIALQRYFAKRSDQAR
ncbi:MAG TPA: hypothetical protein VGM86_10640 [Thermoanaerobaculia bacterium]|jgi:hypothetical protein